MTNLEKIKLIASLIEFRCANILITRKLIEDDVEVLYRSKNKKVRERVCLDIYNKLDYIDILLSKNIDDIMALEILFIYKDDEMNECTKHDQFVYYQ